MENLFWRRVLLVSTDPASNVGQVFGIEIGNRVTPIPAVPNLAALEIDPQAAAQAYRDRIVGPVRGLLPDDVVRGIEEQLSGACRSRMRASLPSCWLQTMIHLEDVARAQVILPGSRLQYRYLFRGQWQAVADWQARLQPTLTIDQRLLRPGRILSSVVALCSAVGVSFVWPP